MKSLFIATAILFASVMGYAQCTPNAPTGNPGVTPDPDNIPCVERGVPYDFTMQTENYDSFSATVSGFSVDIVVNFTRIDSITNFPCGLSWQSDKSQYGPGETGCIRVTGTTTEAVGQYRLGLYMTINFTVVQLNQTYEQSGEVSSLIAQLEQLTGQSFGGDIAYVSNVIEQGANCPARDTSSADVSSGSTCPPLGVTISGVTSICAGAGTTLMATPQFEVGTVSYSWSTGATTPTITVSSTGNYSVTVTDNVGSANASVAVTTGSAPTPAFTATANGAVVTVNNTTANATSYAWNFGDGSTSALQNPPAHTYTSNGTKTITLIATNSCGSDTATQTVTIIGVGISSVQYDMSFEVYPNPSNGNVAVNFVADNASGIFDLKIFDLSGKQVFGEQIQATAGSVQKQLDLSSLPKGVYNLHLSSEKGFGVKRLVLN